MLARILDLPHRVRARNPLPSLRVVISSGDRLDPSLARRFMDAYGDILYNLYGSTEVGIGALAKPAEMRRSPETVGKPVVGCPVRIFDKNGRPVGPRVTGRIFVGGELGAEGYTGGDFTTYLTLQNTSARPVLALLRLQFVDSGGPARRHVALPAASRVTPSPGGSGPIRPSSDPRRRP